MAKNDWMFAVGAVGAGVAGYAKGKRQHEDDQREKQKFEQDREEQGLRIDAARRQKKRDEYVDDLTMGSDPGAATSKAGGFAGPAPAAPTISQPSEAVGGAATTPEGALKMPSAKDRRRAEQQRMLDIARVKGDVTGMQHIQNAMRDDDERDVMAGAWEDFKNGGWDKLAREANLTQTFPIVATTKPDKQGFVTINVITPDGDAKPLRLSQAQQLTIMQAHRLMPTNPEKAAKMLATVDGDLAKAAHDASKTMIDATNAQNNAAYHRGMLANDSAKLSIQQKEADRNRYSSGQPMQFEDEQGNVSLHVPVTDRQTGGLSFRRADMPQGARPVIPRQQATPGDFLKWMETNGDTPLTDPRTGQPALRNGKPLRLRDAPPEVQRAQFDALFAPPVRRRPDGAGVPVPPAPPRANQNPLNAVSPPGTTPYVDNPLRWLPQNDPRRIQQRYGAQPPQGYEHE